MNLSHISEKRYIQPRQKSGPSAVEGPNVFTAGMMSCPCYLFWGLGCVRTNKDSTANMANIPAVALHPLLPLLLACLAVTVIVASLDQLVDPRLVSCGFECIQS